ncbi:MAG: fluoride efflux transporter CrcB [Candidatus Dormibacteria bacterium]
MTDALGTSLLISVGAVLGADARYWLGVCFVRAGASGFPWGTFVINVSGCIVLGAFIGYTALRIPGSMAPRLLVAVGFCGAYTTFSTFSYEAFSYLQERAFALAGGYILASVLAGLVGTSAGYALGSIFGRA